MMGRSEKFAEPSIEQSVPSKSLAMTFLTLTMAWFTRLGWTTTQVPPYVFESIFHQRSNIRFLIR